MCFVLSVSGGRFVLDGFPVTKQQVDIMTKRSIIPVRVIELQVDGKEIANRATRDRYSAKRYIEHLMPLPLV